MGLREINEQRTRTLILDSAFDEFCSLGIEGTEMRQLARKLGIGHATLYRYYGSRHELASAVYLRNLETLTGIFFSFPLRGTAAEILERCFDRILHCYKTAPDKLVFDLIYNLYSIRQHEDPTKYSNHFINSEQFSVFRRTVTDRLHDGSLRDGISWEDIFSVFGSLSGYFQRLSTFEMQDSGINRDKNLPQAERLLRLNLDMLLSGKRSG